MDGGNHGLSFKLLVGLGKEQAALSAFSEALLAMPSLSAIQELHVEVTGVPCWRVSVSNDPRPASAANGPQAAARASPAISMRSPPSPLTAARRPRPAATS